MKAGPPNDPTQDMRWEENDPAWRLLAQAPRPEPDAWFAARTLARCLNEGLGGEARAWQPRFIGMWRWALGGGLAATMAVVLMMNQVQTEPVDKQKNVQEAFEIMASIDTDSDSSATPWQDSSF